MMIRDAVVIWDIDDVWHPFCQLGHEASVAAGIVPDGMENPWVWAPFQRYGCTDQEWFDALAAATLERKLHWSEPLRDDYAAFMRLHELGCQQHFVTARGFMDNPELIREITTEWVDAFFPKLYESLVFTKDKGAAAALITDGYDVSAYGIDDNTKNWDELEAAGVETYLMNRPWNHGHPVPIGRRVNSISEFADAVERGITA